MTGMDNISRCFSLIRSKNAGPFMLTLDLFFSSPDIRRAFLASGVLSPARIGSLYGVDVSQVQTYELPDIDAMKISFPRPIPSGEFGDTDITGGQQYAILVDMIAGLTVQGEGPNIVVLDSISV